MKRSDIVEALIALGYKAEEHETVKNGVIFEGIIINNDAVVAPVIYTQQLIDEAQRRGKGLSDVVNEVIRVYDFGEKKAVLYSEVKSQECFLGIL